MNPTESNLWTDTFG